MPRGPAPRARSQFTPLPTEGAARGTERGPGPAPGPCAAQPPAPAPGGVSSPSGASQPSLQVQWGLPSGESPAHRRTQHQPFQPRPLPLPVQAQPPPGAPSRPHLTPPKGPTGGEAATRESGGPAHPVHGRGEPAGPVGEVDGPMSKRHRAQAQTTVTPRDAPKPRRPPERSPGASPPGPPPPARSPDSHCTRTGQGQGHCRRVDRRVSGAGLEPPKPGWRAALGGRLPGRLTASARQQLLRGQAGCGGRARSHPERRARTPRTRALEAPG